VLNRSNWLCTCRSEVSKVLLVVVEVFPSDKNIICIRLFYWRHWIQNNIYGVPEIFVRIVSWVGWWVVAVVFFCFFFLSVLHANCIPNGWLSHDFLSTKDCSSSSGSGSWVDPFFRKYLVEVTAAVGGACRGGPWCEIVNSGRSARLSVGWITSSAPTAADALDANWEGIVC